MYTISDILMSLSPFSFYSAVARGWPTISKEISMVGNGGPITGCMIHRVIKYSGFQDACVIFFSPVLPFLQKLVIIQIGLI